MTTWSDDPRAAGALRQALADRLVEQGAIRSPAVADAFRTVPRHLFVPHVPLEVAYADDVVLMKSDAVGTAISTVSQPTVVAMMLEQAGLEPGGRVLEIGSGGYNAALLSELAGPAGRVTSIDIDPEVIDRARKALALAGYPAVRVVRADGEFGCPQSAPFDLILVTVTAGDIAPAWIDQLAGTGRIVVPLRLRGQTRSIAFDRAGRTLRSRSDVLCGFVSMQGAGANHERLQPLHGDNVALRTDEDQLVDTRPLEGVLRQPRTVEWSGVLFEREEPFSDLDLWLASRCSEYCELLVQESAVSSGLVRPALRSGGSAVVQHDTLGYLTSRPGPSDQVVELGARAHGPAAVALVDELVDQVRAWDRHQRNGPGPSFTIQPRGTPDGEVPSGAHLTTRHSRITIHWD